MENAPQVQQGRKGIMGSKKNTGKDAWRQENAKGHQVWMEHGVLESYRSL